MAGFPLEAIPACPTPVHVALDSDHSDGGFADINVIGDKAASSSAAASSCAAAVTGSGAGQAPDVPSEKERAESGVGQARRVWK